VSNIATGIRWKYKRAYYYCYCYYCVECILCVLVSNTRYNVTVNKQNLIYVTRFSRSVCTRYILLCPCKRRLCRGNEWPRRTSADDAHRFSYTRVVQQCAWNSCFTGGTLTSVSPSVRFMVTFHCFVSKNAFVLCLRSERVASKRSNRIHRINGVNLWTLPEERPSQTVKRKPMWIENRNLFGYQPNNVDNDCLFVM